MCIIIFTETKIRSTASAFLGLNIPNRRYDAGNCRTRVETKYADKADVDN